MSIGVAFILMSASVSDDSIFYNKDGFIGLDGADSCFLSSEYENGIKTNILAKEKEFYFAFSKDDWQPVANKRYKFKIEFDNEYYDLTTTVIEGGVFLASPHPDFLDSYSGSGGFEISWGSNSVAVLNLAGSSKAISALRSCMNKKGIVVVSPLPQPVSPIPVKNDPFDRSSPVSLRFYNGDDYPSEANGYEGVVKAAVQVGANSRVVDCTVVETSGSAILDEAACKSLRRSSFNAARNRAGQPIDSIFERTVRFEDPTKTVQPN